MDPETLEDVADGEIWGLTLSTFGRSCERHDCCGETLQKDQVLRFKKIRITCGPNGETEEAIVAIRIEDGCETCKVGYIPPRVVMYEADKYEGKEGQVISVYEDEDDLVYKNKAKLHNGVASFRLFANVPGFE